MGSVDYHLKVRTDVNEGLLVNYSRQFKNKVTMVMTTPQTDQNNDIFPKHHLPQNRNLNPEDCVVCSIYNVHKRLHIIVTTVIFLCAWMGV